MGYRQKSRLSFLVLNVNQKLMLILCFSVMQLIVVVLD